MPVTVGLQNVGSFQVAGWPYINNATLDTNEQEFVFNFISQEITVWNAGGEDLKFYFTTESETVFVLPATKKATIRVKSGSIFAKASTSTTTIKLFVSMTNIPVGRIGTIPAGNPGGTVVDSDGDGEIDEFDEFPFFHGPPPSGSSGWAKSGTEDLWMEISGSTEISLDPVIYYLGQFIADEHPVLYPGLEAYYVNVDGDIIDYTSNIESPVLTEFQAIDTNTAGTYIAHYRVLKDGNEVKIPRKFIVLDTSQPNSAQSPITTLDQQMEPFDLFTTEQYQDPTTLDDLINEANSILDLLEVNQYSTTTGDD